MIDFDRVDLLDPRPVTLHCPACGVRDGQGVAFTRREVRTILGLIPYLSITNHYIRCDGCGRESFSSAGPLELEMLSADEIEAGGLLQRNLSMVAFALTTFGLFFFCAPFVGMALSAAAYWINRREAWWIRGINVFGGVLNLAMTVRWLLFGWGP